MTVTVTYYIPVYVVVETDDDGQLEITKIVVDDEAAFDKESRAEEIFSDSEAIDPKSPEAKAAIAFIEEGDSAWPSWEFGW